MPSGAQDLPPPGTPADARVILMAQLAQMKRMADALTANVEAVQTNTVAVERLTATLALVAQTQGVGSMGGALGEIVDQLTGLVGQQPKRRRR